VVCAFSIEGAWISGSGSARLVEACEAFGQGHLDPFGGKVEGAEIALGEGDKDFFARVGAADDEQGNWAGGAVNVFDSSDGDGCAAGHVEEGAANQVCNVDCVCVKRGSVSKGDGDEQAGEGFGGRDGVGLGKVKDDAALMEPMGLKVYFAREWIRFAPQRVRIGDKPKAAAFGELLREISEDVGEYFAFAALGTADAGQPDPFFLRFRLGHLA